MSIYDTAWKVKKYNVTDLVGDRGGTPSRPPSKAKPEKIKGETSLGSYSRLWMRTRFGQYHKSKKDTQQVSVTRMNNFFKLKLYDLDLVNTSFCVMLSGGHVVVLSPPRCQVLPQAHEGRGDLYQGDTE